MQATTAKYWQELWLQREKMRRKPDDSDYWDEHAAEFAQHSGIHSYAESFLQQLGTPTKKTILDFGAGTGVLALPLAKACNDVVACDFSAGMLDQLALRAAADGIALTAEHEGTKVRAAGKSGTASAAGAAMAASAAPGGTAPDGTITTKLLSWTDDWTAAGIADKSVDIALASRSTMVADLAAALDKLERTARERVALTVSTEFTPRGFKQLGSNAEGAASMGGFLPDHLLAMNILLFKGAYPDLHYIDSFKPLKPTSEENSSDSACEDDRDGEGSARSSGGSRSASNSGGDNSGGNASSSGSSSRGARGTHEHSRGIIECDSPDGSRVKMRLIRWAFISWKPV